MKCDVKGPFRKKDTEGSISKVTTTVTIQLVKGASFKVTKWFMNPSGPFARPKEKIGLSDSRRGLPTAAKFSLPNAPNKWIRF